MADSHTSTNTEEVPEQSMASRGESRLRHPDSDAFREFMGSGQGPRIAKEVERCGATDYLPQRAAKVGEPFAGECLVTPAGIYKARNNDCTYRFRTYNASAHLSDLGGEREPGSVFVLEPKESGSYEAVPYFRPRTSRSAQELYSDPQYEELQVGVRPSLEEVHQEMGLRCVRIDALPNTPAKNTGGVKLRIAHGADASIEVMVNKIREQAGLPFDEETRSADEVFEEHLSKIRLCEDASELIELAQIVEVTRAGFEDIVRVLPRVVGYRRGERVVEGAFGTAAREEGNGLGYDTIATLGNHANTLHQTDNDEPANEGDLILMNAGVEVGSLYTAGIARTLLVNGHFAEVQARVHQAILDTCEAAPARADEPEIRFRDIRDATMFVAIMRLREWGLPPASVEESLSLASQQHCHWMPHDTSHHLGLDAHDCAQTRREIYQGAFLEPGMTLMIEPGLYFHADDEVTPAGHRGIDVHIEDDVVVNEGGSIARISEGIPHAINDIEAWITGTWGRRAF